MSISLRMRKGDSVQQLTIDIDADGGTQIKVSGCPGPSCQKLTEAIEKAVGQTVKDVKTGEFHQTAQRSQTQGMQA